MKSNLIDKCFNAALLTILYPLALLPLSITRLTGRVFGEFAFLALGKLRQKVLRHIGNGFEGLFLLNPELPFSSPESIARAFYRNIGMFFVEVIKIHFGHGDKLLDDVEFRGMDNFNSSYSKGKGVLFITAHCGNWEASALAFGKKHHPLSVVVNDQRSQLVNRFLADLRCRYSNDTIHKNGAARKIFAAVRKGGIVGILSDIAVKPEDGILAPFFGKPSWTTTVPAILSLKTGCALLPGFIHRESGALVVEFMPEIESLGRCVEDITTDISSAIEKQIAKHPDEWFWFYNRWRRAPESF